MAGSYLAPYNPLTGGSTMLTNPAPTRAPANAYFNNQYNYGLPSNPYGYSSDPGANNQLGATQQYATGSNLSNSDISNYVNTMLSRGGDYRSVYDAASSFGVSPTQLESAMGWAPGTVDQASYGMGLNPLGWQPAQTGIINMAPESGYGASTAPVDVQNGWAAPGVRLPNGVAWDPTQSAAGNLASYNRIIGNGSNQFQQPTSTTNAGFGDYTGKPYNGLTVGGTGNTTPMGPMPANSTVPPPSNSGGPLSLYNRVQNTFAGTPWVTGGNLLDTNTGRRGGLLGSGQQSGQTQFPQTQVPQMGQWSGNPGTTGTNGPYPGADFSNAAFNGLNAPLWNPNIQNFMDSTITNASNQFLQNTAPALDSQAIAAGGYGGDRANIGKGVAAANAATQIAPIIANTNLQGWNSGADRQLAQGQLGLQGVLGLGGLDLQSQIAQNQYDIGLRNAQTNAASAALGNRYFGSPLAAGIGGGITLAQLLTMLGIGGP
jgi:hypothetical protein